MLSDLEKTLEKLDLEKKSGFDLKSELTQQLDQLKSDAE